MYSANIYKNDDVTLAVYQGKPRKCVLIFSSLHPDVGVSDNSKKTPETVKFYNDSKYGVDVIDQMGRKYSVRTGTRRWPVHSFENTLDLAGINAWILYREICQVKISRRRFLEKLAEELAGPYIASRNLREPSDECDFVQEPEITRYCQVKVNCKKNRTIGFCKLCRKSVCGSCTAKTERKCQKCQEVQN